MGALAPSRWLGKHGYTAGGWETASVRLLPTGRVEAIVGTSPHGQGHVTVFSQIVADTMGVAFDDVDVLHGDTDVARPGDPIPMARARPYWAGRPCPRPRGRWWTRPA